MATLITGVAGFIGFHCAKRMLENGARVIGIDNLNSYYDPTLKEARLAQLYGFERFTFIRLDITQKSAFAALGKLDEKIDTLLHLAAQAGVRHSLDNPQAYIDANATGMLNVLEFARAQNGLRHMVYASSSSVYGKNTQLPFNEADQVNKPLSVYAATKRAGELLAITYSELYRLPLTGLRFFSVYGPWGRPDMVTYLFADRIMKGEPLPIYNNGNMQRDFTYIDDVVDGTLAALNHPPKASAEHTPHALYNIGHGQPEKLTELLALLETHLDKKAIYDFQPLQKAEPPTTFADIGAARRDLSFSPKVDIEDGVPRFVEWFRNYHNYK